MSSVEQLVVVSSAFIAFVSIEFEAIVDIGIDVMLVTVIFSALVVLPVAVFRA